MKRTLCVLFAVLMVASLFTGCVTTGESGQTSTNNTATENASGATESSATGAGRDTVNISINQTLNSVDGQGRKPCRRSLSASRFSRDSFIQ